MPARFSEPKSVTLQTVMIDAIEITAIHINLGASAPPTVVIAREAIHAGERTALPNVTFEASALGELLADATKRTIAAQDIYAGIRDALYARPETLDGLTGATVESGHGGL